MYVMHYRYHARPFDRKAKARIDNRKKGSGPCAPRNKAFLSGESGISYDSELQASSAKKNMCPDIRHVLSLISVRFKMGEKDNIF